MFVSLPEKLSRLSEVKQPNLGHTSISEAPEGSRLCWTLLYHHDAWQPLRC